MSEKLEEKNLSERIVIFLHKRYPRPLPKDELLKMIVEKTGEEESTALVAIEEASKEAEIDEIYKDNKVQYVFIQPGDRHEVLAKRRAAWFNEL